MRPQLATRAGFCLLMHDAEPLKPTNTGWLIADAVRDCEAFGWARTAVILEERGTGPTAINYVHEDDDPRTHRKD